MVIIYVVRTPRKCQWMCVRSSRSINTAFFKDPTQVWHHLSKVLATRMIIRNDQILDQEVKTNEALAHSYH